MKKNKIIVAIVIFTLLNSTTDFAFSQNDSSNYISNEKFDSNLGDDGYGKFGLLGLLGLLGLYGLRKRSLNEYNGKDLNRPTNLNDPKI